jgi:hypothetical protein
MVSAKRGLQEAKGTVRTGYRGDKELLLSAQDLVDLTDSLYEEMVEIRETRRRRGRRGSTSQRRG